MSRVTAAESRPREPHPHPLRNDARGDNHTRRVLVVDIADFDYADHAVLG
jgi:hypothetical protein